MANFSDTTATGRLFIISAPSGSGKSTLVRELLNVVPDLDFSISYTTRPPRGSERSGREYFFISSDEFRRMIDAGEFLEYAEVFGNYYGTALSFVEQARRRQHDLLLDIDIQGAAKVRSRVPDAVSIFIAPPNRKTLEWRLNHRGLDTPEVVQRRLRDASREIAAYNKYDYVVINDDLQDSVDRLVAIVLYERAKARSHEQPVTAEERDKVQRLKAKADSCLTERVGERLRPVLESFGVAAHATEAKASQKDASQSQGQRRQ